MGHVWQVFKTPPLLTQPKPWVNHGKVVTAVDFTEDLLSRLFKSVSNLEEFWEMDGE